MARRSRLPESPIYHDMPDHLPGSSRHGRRLNGSSPLLSVAFGLLCGCSGLEVSTSQQLARFEQAGPYRPKVDTDAFVAARLPAAQYTVAPGDILQFDMPSVMRALSVDAATTSRPHLSRVSSEGKITLPMIGEIDASGQALEEIERAAVEAYHPRYSVYRPAIVATVKEYSQVKVSVRGAVVNPGIHSLASDEKSLVGALMKAGGFLRDGASAVRILRPGNEGATDPIVLPVEGLNLVFADVALAGGETVEVLGLDPKVFTIVGLVNRQGTYDYPPGAKFSLLEAIGFGGGLDQISSPHYVQIFREDASGEIVSATFDIDGDGFGQAAAVAIKPGDIVALADTPMTEFRRVVAGLFRGGVNVMLRYDLSDQLNNNGRGGRN